MKAREGLCVSLAFVALAACGGGESGLSPLPGAADASAPTHPVATAPTATPFPDAGPVDPGGTFADAGVVKRTVTLRNPFGGPAGNLFVDGDIELSAQAAGSSGQFGVLGFDAGGAGAKAFVVETGGLCKSGVHCAVVDNSILLYFRGAAANLGDGVVARLAVRPPAGKSCTIVRSVLVACDTQMVVKKLLPSPVFDDAGWCSQTATLGPRDFGLCLMVQNTLQADETALVDAATLGPDDGTITPRLGEIWVPDAQTTSRLSAIGSYLRRTMPLGRTAPSGPRAINVDL